MRRWPVADRPQLGSIQYHNQTERQLFTYSTVRQSLRNIMTSLAWIIRPPTDQSLWPGRWSSVIIPCWARYPHLNPSLAREVQSYKKMSATSSSQMLFAGREVSLLLTKCHLKKLFLFWVLVICLWGVRLSKPFCNHEGSQPILEGGTSEDMAETGS